ncbi:DNA polymerase III subunit chi [Paraglaciecola aquimarina]|uniref:DNA polymerase III subunit chi n=1 Tax=Paraglaciecola aquimarina TaxID=1235557 RepID=A0ABU3SV41_9ALTE|nr:DNA polymerase III subunit chi [Paraglaciecola aquimarina]MDU0353893.1 DNA polymerase III subunit chi [Paraglaciecola aquimarina]
MSNVVFYLLDETAEAHNQPAHFALACLLATRSYRQKQKCLIYCQNQQQAEQFDELLWQLPNDAFVPHNLAGEGPVGGAPVEICWQPPNQFNRPLLINLTDTIPVFHQRFRQVIDFVPALETLKAQARERYKQYRAAGNQLDTLPASTIISESNDG